MKKTLISLFALCIANTGISANKSPSILLKNATIIDMISDTGRRGDILIKGDKITRIEYSSQGITNDDASVVYHLDEQFIIPGLIDNHVHITHGSYSDAQNTLALALKHGLTSVRDMGGDGRMLTQLKRAALLGEHMAADVYYSTLIAGQDFFANDPRPASVALGAKAGHVPWQWAISDNTDFDNIIAQSKGSGATAIKIYTDVTPSQLIKVSQAAKKQQLQVWAHASVAPSRPSDVLKAGVNVVSHAGDFIQYELTKEVKDRYTFKDAKKAQAYRTSINSIPIKANDKRVIALLDLMKSHNTILDATLLVYQLRNDHDALAYAQNVTKIAYDHGIKISAGTDHIGDGQHINIHRELQLLVDAGLSEIDALRAATIVNAEGLGMHNQIGSIEAGKLANLVVLNHNPLSNIGHTRSIHYVIKRGVVINGISSMHEIQKSSDHHQ